MAGLIARAPSSRPSRGLRRLSRAQSAGSEGSSELARRGSFTDALLETVEVGIVSCDAAGVFMVSNRAERTMFGFQAGIDGMGLEQIDSRIDVFENGVKLEPHEYPLARALRGDDVTRVDVVAGPAGGPYREIVVRGRQIASPDGEVLGAVAALTDVTAERSALRELAAEHRKLAEAQRLGQLGSFDHDFATNTWTFSDHLCALWGLEPNGLTPELIMELVHADDWPLVAESWHKASAGGGAHSCDYRITRASDGVERVIRSNLEVELGPDGNPAHGRGTHLDITDLNAAQKAAQVANAFFDAVLTATPDYTFVTGVDTGEVIYGSRGKDVLGLDSEQLEHPSGTGIATLVHPADEQILRELNADGVNIEDGEVLQTQYRALHADGHWRWLSHRVTPFRRDSQGRVVELLAVVRDVTDVVEAERRLLHAARHDYLTGLPNRALLVERLDTALERGAREGREVAVLFCDLDGFKPVNDTGGHAAGDAVLLESARRLTSVLREGDTVARVGGDEFVIVVEPWSRGEDSAGVESPRAESAEPAEPVERPGIPEPSERRLALQVAQRVAQALSQPVDVGGIAHVVTVSIGITYAAPGRPVTADDVLHEADVAMYLAKERGKNRFEVFEPVVDRVATKAS